ESTPPPATGGVPEQLAVMFEQCQFVEALDVLRKWKPEEPTMVARRDALVLLSQSAAAFLSELGDESAGGAGNRAIVARDGRKFTRLMGGDADGLKVADESGKEIKLDWSEVSPDSLIELHRGLVRESDN